MQSRKPKTPILTIIERIPREDFVVGVNRHLKPVESPITKRGDQSVWPREVAVIGQYEM